MLLEVALTIVSTTFGRGGNAAEPVGSSPLPYAQVCRGAFPSAEWVAGTLLPGRYDEQVDDR